MPQLDLAVVTGAFSYTVRYRKGCRTARFLVLQRRLG